MLCREPSAIPAICVVLILPCATARLMQCRHIDYPAILEAHSTRKFLWLDYSAPFCVPICSIGYQYIPISSCEAGTGDTLATPTAHGSVWVNCSYERYGNFLYPDIIPCIFLR